MNEENTLIDAQTELDAGTQVASVQERQKMPRYQFEVSTDLDLKRYEEVKEGFCTFRCLLNSQAFFLLV